MTASGREVASNSRTMHCEEYSFRLTQKRRNLLVIMAETDFALSAYELCRKYNLRFREPISVMSVYRILELLINENLIHKLHSINKYIACSDLSRHDHQNAAYFYICESCNGVREMAAGRDLFSLIHNGAHAAGFCLNNKQIELQCVCHACQGIYEGHNKPDTN